MIYRPMLIAFIAGLLLSSAIFAQDISDNLANGGSIVLPEGEYTLTRQVSPPIGKGLVLRGMNPSKTRLTFSDGAGIVLSGTAARNFNTWDISGLTLEGANHTATALTLNNATQGRLDRVVFQNFKGAAIDATVWWDSLVIGCDFSNCGNVAYLNPQDGSIDPPVPDPAKSMPAVWLRNANGAGRNCNNLTFIGGRFEANPWVSLRIGGPVVDAMGSPVLNPARSRVNRFLSVKFHSTLPTPTPFDHVWLQSCDDCSFNACNFTNCGGSAVVMTDCSDNDFTGSHIGNSRRWGIEVHACPSFDVRQGVIWSSAGGRNKLGNLTVTSQ